MSVRPKLTHGEAGGIGEDFEPSESNNTHPIKRVALLGHSYVWRLFINKPMYHPDFILRKFPQPGGKVKTITDKPIWEEFLSYEPDLTVLVLGGNDIDSKTVPKQLAKEIESLVLEIEQKTGHTCLVIGIESRTRPRPPLTPVSYNKIKNAVNRWLRHILPGTKNNFTAMGMKKDELCWDGVHLGIEGCINLFERLVVTIRNHVERTQ